MNKVVHICTSILLSTLILFTGSGLIVGKMVCLKSGYELISLEQAKDCCDDDSNKSKIDSRCCDISNFVFHPNIFISENKLSIKTITPIHFDFFSNFFKIQFPIGKLLIIRHLYPTHYHRVGHRLIKVFLHFSHLIVG